jgi:sugar/nucleoside kinase (ribokinase family)
MVLINLISGKDITLETLDEIRMSVREQKTPLYIDLHSLTLGIRDDNTRYRRPVEEWRRWLFMLHAVQMNEGEAHGLTPDRLDEDNLAKHVLALNTAAMFITRGRNGVTAFVDIHKQIQRTDVPGVPSTNTLDPTGCGDVFAAAYCAHYMTTRNVLESVQFANRVAARNAEMRGSADVDELSAFRLNRPSTAEVSP